MVRPSPLFLGILAVAVLGGVLATLNSKPVIIAGIVLLAIGGWTASLCLHEFGHAFTAFRGGDLAVRAKGYLTLDPRHYTDPVMSLVLPLLILVIGGIPLPGGAVWINHHALRSRERESAVALAGPGTNLILGILLIIAIALIPGMPFFLDAGLSYLAFVQIVAFALNIIPIPGLDGYGVLEPYLPWKWQEFGHKARPWAPLALFALILATPIGPVFFSAALEFFRLVGGDWLHAQIGMSLFQFWR